MKPLPPPWLYRLGYGVLHPATRLLRGMIVEGSCHIPKTGRLIVACNHVSYIDPPFVSMAIYSVRFPCFVAKEELFRIPGLGWFLNGIGCIPIDRGRGDVAAMRRILDVLDAEGCVVWFPEGTRSKTGQPLQPKSGVGFLAQMSKAPVVPARVWNTNMLFSREPLRVRFGAPLQFSTGEDRAAFQNFAQRVMTEIGSLT